MYCIYHSRDLDGWTSAAIVKKKYPDAVLIGYDYGQSPQPIIDQIPEKKSVIMCDVAFPMPDMVKLSRNAWHDLTWIDHHASSINEYMNHEGGVVMKTHLNTDKAACELVWGHLFPLLQCPTAIWLLGMYDSFRHKGTSLEKDVLFFQYFARSEAFDPQSAMQFLDSGFDCENGLNIGASIYKYLEVEAKQAYTKGFGVKFGDKKFICFNKERFNPVNFGIDYHEDGWDGSACFWYDGKKVTFSLYNDDGNTDVSEICKKEGGGGHKGAAGFVMTTDEFMEWIGRIPAG